jgi:hypothetical protein
MSNNFGPKDSGFKINLKELPTKSNKLYLLEIIVNQRDCFKYLRKQEDICSIIAIVQGEFKYFDISKYHSY